MRHGLLRLECHKLFYFVLMFFLNCERYKVQLHWAEQGQQQLNAPLCVHNSLHNPKITFCVKQKCTSFLMLSCLHVIKYFHGQTTNDKTVAKVNTNVMAEFTFFDASVFKKKTVSFFWIFKICRYLHLH